jgi:hypothetical protein
VPHKLLLKTALNYCFRLDIETYFEGKKKTIKHFEAIVGFKSFKFEKKEMKILASALRIRVTR